MILVPVSARLVLGCGATDTAPFLFCGGDVSWQAVTWVLEQSQSTLGSRLVLLSIASHANREGKQSWPSVETICIEARLTRREVQYCLRQLEEDGELHTLVGGGRNRCNSYSMPFVEKWLTAQSLRLLGKVTTDDTSTLLTEKGRKVRHKGRNLRQETAQSSAPEPFPNRPKEEPSLESTPTSSFLGSGEPPKTILENERQSEVNSLIIGRAVKNLGKQKTPPPARLSQDEIQRRKNVQLAAAKAKGYL